MNSIFHDCIDDFIVVYLDDLLIFSDTEEDHERHIINELMQLDQNESFFNRKLGFLCFSLAADILKAEMTGLKLSKSGENLKL